SPAPPTSAIYTLSLHDALPILIAATPENALLTAGICKAYGTGVEHRSRFERVARPPGSGKGFTASAALFETDIDSLTAEPELAEDRKSTRLNSSHRTISYAVFC